MFKKLQNPKNMIPAEDFNRNLLEYKENKIVQNLFKRNNSQQHDIRTNKTTRVTRNIANVIDHIIFKCIYHADFRNPIKLI